MIRSVVRGVAIAAIAAGTALGAQVAGATAFTFSFTGAQSGPVTPTDSLSFSSTACTNGAKSCTGSTQANLGLSVYGLHLDNTGTSGGSPVSKAAVEDYKGYGLGVLFGSDTESNGTHQIDNFKGGSDMVALVFDQAVSLTDIMRTSYTTSGELKAGLGNGTDLSFRSWAYSADTLWNGNSQVNLGNFSSLAGGNNATGVTATSKIWLVAANTGQTNDAFKLTSLIVNMPAMPGSVPEPASWAMMIVGFGAVGSQLRRRARTAAAAA